MNLLTDFQVRAHICAHFLLASYSSEVRLLDPNPTRRLIYQIKALLSVFPALIRPSTKLTVIVLENQLSAEAFRALAHLTPKKSLFTQLSYDSETHGARRRSNLDPRPLPPRYQSKALVIL